MEVLDSTERERFQGLQARADSGDMPTAEEQTGLDEWKRTIEAREAAYLRPANERLLLEAERLEGENERLRQLISRNQAIASRLKTALAEAIAEQEAIRRELQQILPSSQTEYAPRTS